MPRPVAHRFKECIKAVQGISIEKYTAIPLGIHREPRGKRSAGSKTCETRPEPLCLSDPENR